MKENSNTKIKRYEDTYPDSFFYKLFPYKHFFAKIDSFYKEKKEMIDKEKIKKDTDENNESNNSKNYEQDNENNEKPEKKESITINASLTNTAGTIYVSGTTVGINVFSNNKQINPTDGPYSFSAGNRFTVVLKGNNFNFTVTIESPAVATSKVLSQLTLSVDPIAMVASISGKLNLSLPGELKGSLYNNSLGSSNSTVVKNGYFSTSVPLQYGTNNLSASGKWLTITLDLPSIQVVVIKG